MLRNTLKFLVILSSFIMMIYPFMLQMGVEEGRLRGAIEVYAPINNIENYSWIKSIDRIYKIGNERIYMENSYNFIYLKTLFFS